MADLNGSKTLENLKTAFAGESEARNKYTFFASKAKQEGYEQIAAIFTETANNEKEHAELWYKRIAGIGDTKANLKTAADGEHYETETMYREFAQVAAQEGFDDIAKQFAGVGAIEAEHEARYLALLKNLEDGKVFKRDGEQIWICRNCGHIHSGAEAPGVCPVCFHAQAYFELRTINY